MNKKEFLDVLRQSLDGEVNSSVIDQNMQYYNQYISSKTLEEEKQIIDELGDPRLIAKTIIEAERVAKQKGHFNGRESYHTNYNSKEEDELNHQSTDNSQNKYTFNLNWWQKIVLVISILAVFVILIFIGKLIIGFLFAFGVPIILVLLLMVLFKKRN